MKAFLIKFLASSFGGFFVDFINTRRRRLAEKTVDAVLDALERGANATKFTTIDDRLVRYVKNERETLVKLTEERFKELLK